jgi:type I restriction enzyme S subunit
MKTAIHSQHKSRPLGDVARFLRGITFKPDDVVEPGTEDSVVCMRTANVQSDLDQSDLLAVPKQFVRRDELYLRETDILVSTANSWNLVGKCCWVPRLDYEATAGGFISILRADPGKIVPRYLYYWFNSDAVQHLVRLCGRQTTNISNMSFERCEALEIPLPPLPEQRRIADILDKAEAIRRKRGVSAKAAKELESSLFQQFFTSRVGRLVGKHIETDSSSKGCDLIAEGWMRTNLGAEITLQRGVDITKSIHRPGPVPVISSGGISGYHDTPYVNGPGVLLGRKGSVGSVHFIDEPYWPHDTTLWVREFNGNDARFVYHFFRHFPIKEYEASTANPSLNRNNLHPVQVWWPPKPLQKAFADVIIKLTKETHPKQIAALTHCEELFNSLVQQAFRGEL